MISELKPCEACNGTGEGGLNAVMDIFCRRCKGLGTRAVPDVPELVRWKHCEYPNQHKMMEHTEGKYVLYSQAAEIIDELSCLLNDKQADLMQKDEIIAAKNNQIDVSNAAFKQNALLWKRIEAAEAKLAQYEAQEPIAYRYRHSENENWYYGETDQYWWEHQPLYAAPTADLKAENERLREVLTKISSPTQATGLLWWQVEARAALNVEASNDKG
ncbi:hypothetical protein P8H26_12605 [Pseudochrobactrum sp. sp1633]|uniref:hypothetical protein n=1 Tax=Pseudochrobactrum sp. sp1633 TaxID=3036706 RepID=UPI0025A65745|nr:hypothetical protein [Pseudochrobactrum sp. sp1633]MDM8346231.1 hypothetical protein [Pseudochrobactrum sp. sp1633]